MKSNTRAALALLCAALLAGGVSPAQAETGATRVPVADYTVFVDPPTGFVFVKLPQGWKFAGRVAPEDVARLPPTIVTALLAEDAARLAAGIAVGTRPE